MSTSKRSEAERGQQRQHPRRTATGAGPHGQTQGTGKGENVTHQEPAETTAKYGRRKSAIQQTK